MCACEQERNEWRIFAQSVKCSGFVFVFMHMTVSIRCLWGSYFFFSEFGTIETPDIDGEICPPDVKTPEDLLPVCGKSRGIQGHHNSCYLDATLFSMFYFTTVFDFIFNEPPRPDSVPEHQRVQKVLKEGIVNPLRRWVLLNT